MNKLIPTLVLFLITSSLYSTDYYTIASGNYTDAISVWSLDGVTPCGCSPGSPLDGDTVYINHDINLDINLVVQRTSLLHVSSSGRLEGPYTLLIRYGAEVLVEGVLELAKLTVKENSTITVFGGVVNVTDRALIYGNFDLDGGVFLCGGNILIYPDANISTLNGSWIKAVGNFQNSGTLFICATCCVSTSTGNLFVEPGASVSGSGGFYSEVGNISNDGVIDLATTWCVAGSSTGMAGNPMDCTGTVAICSVSPLASSELIFNAEMVNNISILNWKELGQDLPSKYIVETSRDLDTWVEEATIYPRYEIYQYAYNHPNSTNGMTYYRIVSVDSYSEKTYSDPIGLIRENQSTFIYPTVIPKDKIQFSIYSHERDESEISIIDYSGKIIYGKKLILERGENQINVDLNIRASHYIITVLSGNRVTSHKAVIY